MPRSCDVLGCPNGAGNASISYHVVPVDEPRRSEWLAAVPMRKREGRSNGRGPPKLMVCSQHFSPCDYVYDPALRQSLGCRQRPALSRTAVPTIAPLTRQELALLRQEIGSLERAGNTGASIFGIDGSEERIEGNADVLPLVVCIVEGQPSSSWLQTAELIQADGCVPPSEAMPTVLREHAVFCPPENSNRSFSRTTSVSPKCIDLGSLDMLLDVSLVEGQPLPSQLQTKTGSWCSPSGSTLVSAAADSKKKEMQELSTQSHRSKTNRTSHHGIGHNKMVQVCIRGRSTGTQVNMTMKEVMSECLQTDIPDEPLLTSTSTQT